ncbi:MAG: DUF2339 domain-containing protein [Bacteroidota bacterium]
MEEPVAGTSRHRQRQHGKSSRSGKTNPYRRVESVISKHLLKVVGFIFIMVVAGYSVSSLDKLRTVVKQLLSHEPAIQHPGVSPAAPVGIASVTASSASYNSGDIKGMFIFCSLITLFFAALLLFSIRIRRKEIPRISIIVFYALAFILARKYGWQIHFLFPMMLVFSALIFFSGNRLHSMMAGKWNYLLCWGFFLIWWAMKVILGGKEGFPWEFFVYGGLFYLLFFYMGIIGAFKGRHKFSEYTEIGLIVLNSLVFYLMGIVVFIKFRQLENAWIFSLLLASINIGILIPAANAGKKIKPGPYVFPAMVILSLIFPFIFQASAVILFLAVLSSLLLFYSKYSGDRVAVLTALLSIVVMLLVYFKDWVFLYLPAAFFGNVLDNQAMMIKGLVAGLVIFPVIIINSRLVRKLHVDFSKEWFSRRSYQRFFKGINLIVLYLSGFWIVNYYVLVLSKNPDLNYMSWFGYNCLFFIIALPALWSQKSRFLSAAVGFALFFSLAYPTLIHFTTLNLRNELLQHEHLSRLAFWFHYPVVLLFITELIMLLIFLRRAFEKSSIIIRIFTMYILLMGLFILLSEYDHFSIWTGLKRGITIEEIVLANKVIPYTLILFAYSAVILGVGMISRNRLLRAAGLVFLLGTLVKMLYTDVRALSGTTRSLLLFTLGLIVLTLSFMYPKLKRYFRHREHEVKGISKRHRHHTRRKPVSISGGQGGSANETL